MSARESTEPKKARITQLGRRQTGTGNAKELTGFGGISNAIQESSSCQK